MYPASFEYFAVESLDEALRLLEEYGEEAKVLAGGQSLIPMLKLRLARPKYIIDINRIAELKYIKIENEELVIGALTRISKLNSERVIRDRYPIIADATSVIADVQVRNMGTVGGNISHGDPANDLPAVFMALDARLVLASRRGRREVSIKQFYKGPFETVMEPDEILVEVKVPLQGERSGGAYVKLEKRAGDFAIAGVAAQLVLDEEGHISKAGLGYTNLAPTPLAGDEAASRLVGKKLDQAVLDEVKKSVETLPLSPSSDLRGPEWYKIDMAKVLTLRALKTAWQRAGGAWQ